MTNKITLPGGTIVIDEAPQDGVYYGRINASWLPVTEEVLPDDKLYARRMGKWEEIVSSGVYVQDDPPALTVPPDSLWWESDTGDLHILYDDGSSVQWVQIGGGGTPTELDFGIGLSKDESATPPIVHLQPAGDSPATLGGVYVVDRVRNVSEGLELGIDGRLRAPLATDSLAGTLLEPPPDDKGYVRRRTAAGVSSWVPPALPPVTGDEPPPDDKGYVRTTHLNGVSQWVPPALSPLATPDEPGLIEEPIADAKGYVRTTYADGTSQWVPPALPPVTADEPPPDDKGYVRTTHTNGVSQWVPPALPPLATPDVSGLIEEPVADAKGYVRTTQLDGTSQWVPPAPTMDEPPPDDKGYVRTTHLDGVSQWVPPALPALATPEEPGLIEEPIADDKGYVRTTHLDGTSQWVPPAPSETLIAGNAPKDLGSVYIPARNDHNQGLDLNGDGGLYAPPATHEHLGTLLEPPEENKQYARFRDPTTHNNQWVEVEGGMEEPPMDPVQTWGRSSGGARGWLPIPDSGIEDVPPAPRGQLWARELGLWRELPPSEIVAAGIGLDKVGPVINLRPPTPGPALEIGGVYGTPRSDRNAVVIDAAGHINVPEATDLLLGGILEPPPDEKAYARKRGNADVSTWVEVGTDGIEDVPTTPVEIWGRTPGRWVPLDTKGNAVQPRKVNVAGDQMTGQLILYGDPTDFLGAVPLRLLTQTQAAIELWTTTYFMQIPPAGGPYWMLDGAWSNIPANVVTPKIAGNLPLDVGVVYVPARNKTSQGLDLNADGGLFAPPATHEHLGTIVEAPNDGKNYVRNNPVNGTANWVLSPDVKIATTTTLGVVKVPARSLNTGLDIDAQGNLTAPRATHAHAGTILEPTETGKQYARFRDPVTGINAWQEIMAGGVIISDTPPANPQHGMLWWESDLGDLFVYYDDGTSAQWVEAVAGAEPGITMHVSDTPPDPMVCKPKDLWFDSNSGSLAINYQDVDSTAWVQIGGSGGAAAGGITEAPIDGTPYSRQDAAWVAAAAGGGGLPDAPNDGVQYTRGAPTAGGVNAWTPSTAATGAFLPLTGGTLTGALKIETGKYLTLDKPLTTNWAGMWFTTGAIAKWEWDLTDNNDNMVLRRFDAGGIPKLVQQVTQNNGVSTFFGPINIRGIDGANPTLSFNEEMTGSDIWTVKSLAPNQSLYFTSYGANAKGDMFILDAKNDRADFMCPLFVNNTPVTMMTEHQAALERIGVLEALLTKLQARLDTCCPE